MTLTLAAVIALVWFGLIFWALAIIRAGSRHAPPVPPARPRARRVDIDLDDIDWDWRQEEAA